MNVYLYKNNVYFVNCTTKITNVNVYYITQLISMWMKNKDLKTKKCVWFLVL